MRLVRYFSINSRYARRETSLPGIILATLGVLMVLAPLVDISRV